MADKRRDLALFNMATGIGAHGQAAGHGLGGVRDQLSD
jgi:hypothetical protein